MEEDVTKTVIKALTAYLSDELPLDKDFIRELDCRNLLASSKASMLVLLVDQRDKDCIYQLITYMEQFYTEETLLRLCDFLEEYAQLARPKLASIASKIRQEILKRKPQVPLPAPEDTLHRRAGVHDGNATSSDDRSQPAYLPVIDELKASFCNLVANVFSAIYCLKDLTLFRTFLSHFLKPSFPPGALSPAVPKTVEELDLFLADRWNSVNIHLLKAVVLHLASRKNESTVFCETIQQVQSELKTYEDLLKVNLHEFLSNCSIKSVSLKPLPGHSSVTVKVASSPAEVSLALIVELQDFFISQLGLPDTLFTGFSEGCTILFFSFPTEYVWSLPSCLIPSNLSLLEKWKVIFFSVKGAFTVDIKERKVIDSLDKHSLLSSLSEYKTLIEDLQQEVSHLKAQAQRIKHSEEESSEEKNLMKEHSTRPLPTMEETAHEKLKRFYTRPQSNMPGKAQFINLALVERPTYQSKTKKDVKDFLEATAHGIDQYSLQQKNIEYETILTSTGSDSGKRVLISGPPGSGKTTLAHKLCRDLYSGHLPNQYQLVLFTELKAFRAYTNKKNKEAGLRTLLEYSGFHETASNLCSMIRKKEGRGVAIILDGYDEISDDEKLSEWVSDVFTCAAPQLDVSQCDVFITTRPSQLPQLCEYAPVHLEVLGFSNSSDIECYIKAYFQGAPDRAEEVIRRLTGLSLVRGLCSNPGVLEIACKVLKHLDEEPLPANLSGIFLKYICYQLEVDLIQRQSPVKTDRIKDLLSISEELFPGFYTLCSLAYKCCQRQQLVLEKKELGEVENYINSRDSVYNLLFGKMVDSPSKILCMLYKCDHKAVMETLAAVHIAVLLPAEQQKIWDEWFTAPRMAQVWMMYCSLTSLKFVDLRRLYSLTVSKRIKKIVRSVWEARALEDEDKLVMVSLFEASNDEEAEQVLPVLLINNIIGDIRSQHDVLVLAYSIIHHPQLSRVKLDLSYAPSWLDLQPLTTSLKNVKAFEMKCEGIEPILAVLPGAVEELSLHFDFSEVVAFTGLGDALRNCHHLRSLEIGTNCFHPALWTELNSILNNSSLTEFHCTNTATIIGEATPLSMETLKSLLVHREKCSLHMSLNDHQISALLSDLKRAVKLKKLDLRIRVLSSEYQRLDTCAEVEEQVATHPHLVEVDFISYSDHQPDYLLSAVAKGAIRNKNVTHLGLRGDNIRALHPLLCSADHITSISVEDEMTFFHVGDVAWSDGMITGPMARQTCHLGLTMFTPASLGHLLSRVNTATKLEDLSLSFSILLDNENQDPVDVRAVETAFTNCNLLKLSIQHKDLLGMKTTMRKLQAQWCRLYSAILNGLAANTTAQVDSCIYGISFDVEEIIRHFSQQTLQRFDVFNRGRWSFIVSRDPSCPSESTFSMSRKRPPDDLPAASLLQKMSKSDQQTMQPSTATPVEDQRTLALREAHKKLKRYYTKPAKCGKHFVKLAIVKRQPTVDKTKKDVKEFLEATAHGIDRYTGERKNIEYETILTSTGSNSGKRVLISGSPGSGKTTLAHQLCRDLYSDHLPNQYQLVLFAELKALKSYTLSSKKNKEASLLTLLKYINFPDAGSLCSMIGKEEGKGVAIILDGYDEISDDSCKPLAEWVSEAFCARNLQISECDVFITTRPSQLSQFVGEHDPVFVHLEILGFSSSDIKCYIKAYFKSSSKKSAEVIDRLTRLPLVLGLCSNPRVLQIACKILKHQDEEPLPANLSGIFLRYLCYQLEVDLTQRQPPVETKIKDVLCVPEDLFPGFRTLCSFAYKCCLDQQLMLEKQELGEVKNYISNRGSIYNLLFGEKVDSPSGIPCLLYQCDHKTVMEALAAVHIAVLSKAEQQQIWEKWFTAPHMAQVWMMYCGLTGLKHVDLRRLCFLTVSERSREVMKDFSVASMNVIHALSPGALHDEDKLVMVSLFEANNDEEAKRILPVLLKNNIRTNIDSQHDVLVLAYSITHHPHLSRVWLGLLEDCSELDLKSLTTSLKNVKAVELRCDKMESILTVLPKAVEELSLNFGAKGKTYEGLGDALKDYHHLRSLRIEVDCDPASLTELNSVLVDDRLTEFHFKGNRTIGKLEFKAVPYSMEALKNLLVHCEKCSLEMTMNEHQFFALLSGLMRAGKLKELGLHIDVSSSESEVNPNQCLVTCFEVLELVATHPHLVKVDVQNDSSKSDLLIAVAKGAIWNKNITHLGLGKYETDAVHPLLCSPSADHITSIRANYYGPHCGDGDAWSKAVIAGPMARQTCHLFLRRFTPASLGLLLSRVNAATKLKELHLGLVSFHIVSEEDHNPVDVRAVETAFRNCNLRKLKIEHNQLQMKPPAHWSHPYSAILNGLAANTTTQVDSGISFFGVHQAAEFTTHLSQQTLQKFEGVKKGPFSSYVISRDLSCPSAPIAALGPLLNTPSQPIAKPETTPPGQTTPTHQTTPPNTTPTPPDVGELLEKYKDRILSDVMSSLIFNRLEVEKVISDSVALDISKTTNREGNCLIYKHLTEQGDLKSLQTFGSVLLTKEEGCPKMQRLGEDLLDEITLPHV